jgi:hypothetical protein
MRMWNIDPKLMCNKHLLGEHVEMHMFVGSINKGISIKGYIDKGLVNTGLLKNRHEELVKEMIKREMKHNTPLLDFDIKVLGYVDSKENEEELLRRCVECRRKHENKN